MCDQCETDDNHQIYMAWKETSPWSLDEPHLLNRQRLAFCECTNARCFSGVVVNASNVGCWPIVLQKSHNAVRPFRKEAKQAAIVRRYSFRLATEVTGQLVTK
jgi:hypothetical protein